ncbi:unnamed protein product [Schistosoma rodhaini]|uniref:Uncharacterized protein n=1 Tax=Schistosoma rodhaini TaxID=6188 RepID=A0AA85GLC3_9TREM|nr:unnamed protein product [Schistosoma rodhaini]
MMRISIICATDLVVSISNKSGEYPSAIIILGDLVQTEKAARNTSDSKKRGILEREVEDLINGINALEASPELKAAEERNLDTTDKYFNALNDHLEILKNLEIQRIDVLELLSSKKRIQMYESILQEECCVDVVLGIKRK